MDTAVDMTDQREVVQVEYDKIVRDFDTRGKEILNYEKNKV